MIVAILDWLRETRAIIGGTPCRLLEVGSFNVNGTPRVVFADAAEYIGVDIAPGPGVDVVLDGEAVAAHFPAGSFDTVVCCETLEHCVRPWVVADAMRAVLKPGGLLWVTAPTYGFPLHRHPLDCYRFGEDAFRHWLYAGMDLLRLETLRDDAGQPVIAAVGRSPR